MSLLLVRVDDRLIHGQVVLGWGLSLGADLIILVDDQVQRSPWEQELYAMGVPPEVEVQFASVERAVADAPAWARSTRRAILVTGDVETVVRLCERTPVITEVNLGGLHQRDARRQRLPYVFLTDAEAADLAHLVERGVTVTAQDVPTARPVPLAELV